MGRRAGSDASNERFPPLPLSCLHRSSPAALAFVTIRATCRLYRRAEGVSHGRWSSGEQPISLTPKSCSPDPATHTAESHQRGCCSWCPRPFWAGRGLLFGHGWYRLHHALCWLMELTPALGRRGLDQVPTRQLRGPHLVCRAPGGGGTRLSHLPSGKVPPRNRHCPALRDGPAPSDVD